MPGDVIGLINPKGSSLCGSSAPIPDAPHSGFPSSAIHAAVDIFAERAAPTRCDVAVIGAGPGGALAARLAAESGLKTVLLDAKRFPRDKVCGDCLNSRALDTLGRHGLGHVVSRAGGVPITQWQILAGRRSLNLDLPEGVALSRKVLDQRLVEEAISAGVGFLPETSATVATDCGADCRTVTLAQGTTVRSLQAGIVIVADGLLRSSLKHFPAFASEVSPRSRLGAGTTLEDHSEDYPPGRITMAVSQGGYVGVTRLEDARLNLAAALDPVAVKTSSIAALVRQILEQSGSLVPAAISGAAWIGTPMLTSRPRTVADERIFLIGDAAGYIEPFTGEGMALALECASAVIPLVVQGSRQWDSQLVIDWVRMHRTVIGRRQWICRSVAAVLRSPLASAAAMCGCRWFPAVPRYFISKISDRGRTSGRIKLGTS